MLPTIRRIWCRLWGCPEPTIAFDKRGRMLIWCPRCLHVKAGEDVARDLGLVRKE